MSYILKQSVWWPVLIAATSIWASVLATPAVAAPTEVGLRIEGRLGTIYESPVLTDGRQISNSGESRLCNGEPGNPGGTPTTALDDASGAGGFTWESTFFGDFFVSRIGPDENDFGASESWFIWVNNVLLSTGGCDVTLEANDRPLFAIAKWDQNFDPPKTLKLQVASSPVVEEGQSVSVKVEALDKSGGASPEPGVPISGGEKTVTSGTDGSATLTFPSAGEYSLKADRSDFIRSNSLRICVYKTGSGACNTYRGPAIQADNIAPLSRVLWPKKKRYRRGPRVLKGYVDPDPSGLKAVKIRLRRKTGRKGSRCRGFNFTREHFSVHCKRSSYKKVGEKPSWSYQLPKALGPGLYRLDVKATDGAGNVSKLSFGHSRVFFRVLNRRRR